MELSSSHQATARPCPDPECVDQDGNRSLAEPEQDGDVTYHECPNCAYAFGYERIQAVAVNPEGTCAVGIPETIRRAASAPAEHALASAARQLPPLLQIGHRDDRAS